jgi:hypothetical protein
MPKSEEVTPLPSYSDLAQLLVKLTEMNVANLDNPDNMFVSCFAFGSEFPDLWLEAMKLRRQFIASKIAKRGSHDKPYKCIPREQARKELSL